MINVKWVPKRNLLSLLVAHTNAKPLFIWLYFCSASVKSFEIAITGKPSCFNTAPNPS